MTPPSPDDLRLYEQFVRYWDNTLPPNEALELEERLAADSEARDWFHLFALHAVAAADLSAVPREPAPRPEPIAPDPLPDSLPRAPASPAPATSGAVARLSRRRLLQFAAGGLAAGVGGVGAGWWLWPASHNRQPRLVAARGTVSVRTPEGDAHPADGPLPEGAAVATHGLGSSIVIAYPDGSTVSLLGDSTIETADRGHQLHLRRGAASADVRRRGSDVPALSLATAQVLLPALSNTLITLGRAARATDVEVERGQVNASAPSGEELAVVRAGELLTVEADGDLRKRRSTVTPEEFAWDLSKPLPEGWEVGVRAVGPDGPVIRPESWPDPYYHGTRMYQIRSDQQWLRGFFRFMPDSRLLVRYRARSAGRGQVCFCARTDQARCPDTGMLEYNGGFEATGGAWRWLDVSAETLLAPPNREGPKFGAPWIGFLLIVNTFEADLGLEIAGLRVTRSGAAAG